jgi:hypothetical protein
MGLDKNYRVNAAEDWSLIVCFNHWEDWHCVDYVLQKQLNETLREDQHRAISEWCCDTLKDNWTSFAGRYYFRDEQDLAWFSLRWL